jgi:hypothetical protein
MTPRRTIIGSFAVCALTVVASAQAQQAGPVRLTVRSSAGAPLMGAQVRGGDAITESDDGGLAILPRIATGDVWVRVRRIGFRPDSVLLVMVAGKSLDTAVALKQVAIDLTPVRVVGRRDVQGPMAGFYARQATSSGRFFTRADIERRAARSLPELLRGVPGVRIESRGYRNNVRVRGSRCAPLVWLDGQPLFAPEVDLDSFDPTTLDGVEVYSVSSVPVEFAGNRVVSSACGTIVLWSRRGDAVERTSKRKKGEPSAAARIAQMLDEQRAFTANDVDVVARLDSFIIVHPEYPDSLFEARASGRVLAEFVVSSNGSVQIETYNPVTTTSRLLIEPVRRALKDQRFVPAVRQGQPVHQVMQLPFDFVPDSTSRRKH